jgi:hypothetical protein
VGYRRKTRAGRLRQLDELLLSEAKALLERRDGPFADAPVVDLGLGARPWTTLELADALAPHGVPVLGVDIAPDVVEDARRIAHAQGTSDRVRFAIASFALPVRARLVRVMNVLRDGGPDAARAAHAALAPSVLPGGVVVEGSSGATGEVGAAHWLVRDEEGLRRDSLLFWTDGTRGTAPNLFRDRLPRDLRGDHPIKAVLADWMAAYLDTTPGPQRLTDSLVRLGPGWSAIGRHAVRYRPPGGIP